MRNNSEIPAIANQPMSELELRFSDGTAWTLSVSPAMERFIGRYPRVAGIAPAGELLTFREGSVRA
jgi:hypothetical protein